MRILKLEFENLNSLKGFWSIDFTNPDYAKNHDVFVICGPTGSGKTTILDAITLALYGKTPRLGTINNGESGNEIMTRGTGFCRAQVTYSCKKGVFVSEFQQNRANLKASGNLQKASFKITDAQSGEVYMTGTGSNLEKETQKIIQLDYKQFCRSIMLAQGEFSAFLESDSRERAEILEKLTGTERFRKIAQKVAEKFSDTKKSYSLKKTEKEEIEKLVLTSDEQNAAENQMEEVSKNLSATEKELEKLNKELSFYQELDRLNEELESAQKQKDEILLQVENFVAEENRLKLADSARNVESEFQKFESLNKRLLDDSKELEKVGQDIILAENSFLQAEKNCNEIKDECTNQEKQLAESQIVWKKVRELDVRIAEAQKNYLAAFERKTQSENLFKETNQKKSELENEVKNLNEQILQEKTYLESNKADENLLQIIAKLETLFQNADAQFKAVQEFTLRKDEICQENERVQNELQNVLEELKNVEQKITEFVSGDALVIAKILQLQLKEGNPCPVCGSVYHKNHGKVQAELDLFSETESQDEEFQKKSHEIAAESSGLNEKREELESLKQELSAKIQTLQTDLKNTQENLDAANKNFEENILQIKNLIQPWKKDFKFEDSRQILDELRQKSDLWQQKDSGKKEKENLLSAKSAQAQSLQENFENQNEQLQKELQETQKLQESLEKIKQERFSLFGEKSPDLEESEKNQLIEKLKNDSSQAEVLRQKSSEEKTRLTTVKTQLEKNIAELEPQNLAAKIEFEQKCRENSFENAQSFLNARMEKSEFDSLSKKSEELKTKKTQAETSFKNAEKSFLEFKKSSKLTRPKQEVLSEKEEILAKKDSLNDSLIEIKTKLQTNEQNLKRAQKILAEFNVLQEEFSVWEQMDKWVGKANGSDMSVFVQSLAFNSLLNLANNNLFGITGRYSLVQKEKSSLDFEIQDIYFEGTRSVENLSGGEKFLVSLSFALAISEFASKNVQVDSLFLDEGFGTLSGELLTEAINALKNLEKKGKMLGIITHVQDVINEIDQKIEVKQVSGGHSVLIGSGIQTKNQK